MGGGTFFRLAAEPVTPACVRAVVAAVGRRAWRRPLTEDELATLATFHEAVAVDGARVALGLTLERLPNAPEVLFRFEQGALDPATGFAALTPHERADLIAFTPTDLPPDAIAETAGERQVIRGVLRFFREWLRADEIRLLRRPASRRFPDIENEERILRWLDNELMMFARHAFCATRGTR